MDIEEPDMGRKYYVVCAKMLISNKKKYGTAQIKIKSMTGLKSREVIYKSCTLMILSSLLVSVKFLSAAFNGNTSLVDIT